MWPWSAGSRGAGESALTCTARRDPPDLKDLGTAVAIALGIPATGRGVSRRLAAPLGTVHAFASPSTDQLADVEMIGDRRAS